MVVRSRRVPTLSVLQFPEPMQVDLRPSGPPATLYSLPPNMSGFGPDDELLLFATLEDLVDRTTAVWASLHRTVDPVGQRDHSDNHSESSTVEFLFATRGPFRGLLFERLGRDATAGVIQHAQEALTTPYLLVGDPAPHERVVCGRPAGVENNPLTSRVCLRLVSEVGTGTGSPEDEEEFSRGMSVQLESHRDAEVCLRERFQNREAWQHDPVLHAGAADLIDLEQIVFLHEVSTFSLRVLAELFDLFTATSASCSSITSSQICRTDFVSAASEGWLEQVRALLLLGGSKTPALKASGPWAISGWALRDRFPHLWEEGADMCKGELFRRCSDVFREETGRAADWTLIVGDGTHERLAARAFATAPETKVTLLVLPAPSTPTALHFVATVALGTISAGGIGT